MDRTRIDEPLGEPRAADVVSPFELSKDLFTGRRRAEQSQG